jgi:hypothetical protein
LGELYELSNDRNQVINLWDDPESQHPRHELSETVTSHSMELANASPPAMRDAT